MTDKKYDKIFIKITSGSASLQISLASAGGKFKDIGGEITASMGDTIEISGAAMEAVFPIIDGSYTAKVERRIASR